MSTYQMAEAVEYANEARALPGFSVAELKGAFRCGQLAPYLQPLVDVERAGLIGAECLLRWDHPRRGLLPAARFLRLVEEANLLGTVDLSTARKLASELPHLDQAGRGPHTVWLNASVAEFFCDSFLEALVSIIERAGLKQGRIGLEIRQAVLAVDDIAAKRRLVLLHRLGVPVAIDHFGSRFSFARRLSGVPFDVVKLDPALVRRLEGSRVAERAVRELTDLAHSSSAVVIAEGVERQGQLEAVRQLGCDGAQGYLVGDPVPLSAMLERAEPSPPPCTWWG
jgi:EAL domain-containing protein (putative c-di-GMP-specific phosphodiesterase class I)